MDEAEAERHRKKRPVSLQHVEELLNHMEQFPTFALASIRCKEGTQSHSNYMWDRIATELNKMDEDVQKSPKAWARFWVDLRFKVRRKYVNYVRCARAGREWHGEFTAYQQRIVKLLTDGDGNLIDTIAGSDRNNRLSKTIDNSDNGGQSNHAGVKVERNDQTFSDTEEETQVQNTEVSIKDKEHKKINPSSNNKAIEELNREIVEFELRHKRELMEIDKKHREEKHVLEMSILEIRKQLLVKELSNS